MGCRVKLFSCFITSHAFFGNVAEKIGSSRTLNTSCSIPERSCFWAFDESIYTSRQFFIRTQKNSIVVGRIGYFSCALMWSLIKNFSSVALNTSFGFQIEKVLRICTVDTSCSIPERSGCGARICVISWQGSVRRCDDSVVCGYVGLQNSRLTLISSGVKDEVRLASSTSFSLQIEKILRSCAFDTCGAVPERSCTVARMASVGSR